MIWTAVQETSLDRGDIDFGCRVVYGEARARIHGARGPIAVFAPDAVVLYAVHARHARTRFCGLVFRTLQGPEAGDVAIAGVRPRVRLLLTLPTERRLGRMCELLQRLEDALMPNGIPDALLLRAAPAIAGRAVINQVARSLLYRT
jgi:hypothetical protein